MMTKTKQRLSQIKNSLTWQDYEMAELQLSLLTESQDGSVVTIIEAIKSQSYKEALGLIESVLNETSTNLVEYEETELEDLRVQLKELEEVIEDLNEQKSEQLFLLNEFNTKLSLATGEVVQQILQLKKEIEQEKLRQKQEKIEAEKLAYEEKKEVLESLKKQRAELEETLEELDEFDPEFDEVEVALNSKNEEIRQQQEELREQRQKVKEQEAVFEETTEETFQEAEDDYQAFEESYQEAQEDKVAQLKDEDAGVLKKLFRKATRLCHPDTVADEIKEQANEIMKQLNQARDQGDIEGVKLLLEKLEKGTAFVLASDALTDREQVEDKIAELLAKLEEISLEIEAINDNETWQLLGSIESWDDYFNEQLEGLTEYLDQIRNEFDELFNETEFEEVQSNDFQSKVKPSPEMSSTTSSKPNASSDSYWEEDF